MFTHYASSHDPALNVPRMRPMTARGPMRIEQRTRNEAGWSPVARPMGSKAQLALAFAPITRLTEHRTWAELIELYPGARIVGCSTAAEIAGARVLDDALVAT